MLQLAISVLSEVCLYDLDNGSMVLHISDGLSDYRHNYDNMKQLATDLLEYAESQTAADWEGNEPEIEIDPSMHAYDIIDDDGAFSGSGCAYKDLIRALVAQMHDDYIYLA